MLIGIAIYAYPAVSQYLAKKNQSEVIENYDESIEDLSNEEINEELEKATIYNENLSGDPVHDPFIQGSGYAIPDNYWDVLNLSGDGIMGYIKIPKISVYLPIYHGTDEEILEKGVGHIEQSSLPVGGESTHSVLSAHTGLPSAELFTNLIDLEVGDCFYIYVLDETLKYEVSRINIVLPDDVSTLTIEDGEDLVTLVTCTPYGVNTHRLLVTGTRVEFEAEEETSGLESSSDDTIIKLYIKITIAVAIATIIFIIIFNVYKRHKKNKQM